MNMSALLRESWTSGRAQLVSFLLIVLLGAAMCTSTLLTAGRGAASEDDIRQQLDGAGSREILVTDVKNQGLIQLSVVAALSGTSTVTKVIGLSAPQDVFSASIGSGGSRVPSWLYTGPIQKYIRLVAGRYPRIGEAIVSSSALHQLGLDTSIGAIRTDQAQEFPIVGEFQTQRGDDPLATGALIHGSPLFKIASLRVTAASYQDASSTQEVVLGMINSQDPNALAVESPTSLANLQRKILANLTNSDRLLVALSIGAGSALVLVVCLSEILIRRKDLGRRRALGITRADLIKLVVLQTTIPAIFGSAVGSAVGSVLSLSQNVLPPYEFIVGVFVLSVGSATVASFPPAVIAAYQDPVRVLRTP